MKRERIHTLVLSGLFAALTCVATLIIHIPTVTKGYVNLGDCIVNISAWVLGPAYAAASAGIGSALADIISGYAVYAPATLVIKALMAVTAYIVYAAVKKRTKSAAACISGAIAAELVMCGGYFLFEGLLYHSFAAAALGITGNLMQGLIGTVSSVFLYETIAKHIPFKSGLSR